MGPLPIAADEPALGVIEWKQTENQEIPDENDRSEQGQLSAEEEEEPEPEPYIWPVSGFISSPFGHREISVGSSEHAGIDIAAEGGKPIAAAKSGVISYADVYGGYGKLVIIAHPDGTSTWYGHCSELCVTPGQSVEQGQTIALVGSTGISTGNHCHFEVHNAGGEAIDPETVLPEV